MRTALLRFTTSIDDQRLKRMVRWLRSFGQFFRFDKWSAVENDTAKRTGVIGRHALDQVEDVR